MSSFYPRWDKQFKYLCPQLRIIFATMIFAPRICSAFNQQMFAILYVRMPAMSAPPEPIKSLSSNIKEYYSSSVVQCSSLSTSRDLSTMCRPVNSTILMEMDEVISCIDDVALHLAQNKLDLMKERVLIARRGIIAEHETAHWRNFKTTVSQLHDTVAHGKWGSRQWESVKTLPMCAACHASASEYY